MSQKWFNGLNLQQNQLENAVIQNLASDPSSGKAGQIYYNTTDNGYRYYNGTAWVSISADAIKTIVAGNGLTSSTSGNAVTLTLGTPSTSGAASGNTLGDNNVTENSHTHQIRIPSASTTERGIVQLATDTDVTTGTETTKAVTPKQLAAAKQDAINSAKVTIQTSDGLTGGSSTPATSFTLGLSNSGVTADTYNSVTVDAKGRVTAGEKKDYVETSALDAYQKKQDNALNTTAKTVVGAINEVKGTADAASTKATTNATEITNIKNGTTVVGKANKVANPLTISDGTNSTTYDGSAARTLQFKPEDFSESISGGTATVALKDKGYATKTYVDAQDDKKLDKAGGIITGDLTIGGNVTVNGTTTTVNSNTLTVKDKLIEVAKDNTTTLTSPAGIIVPKYNGTDYGALVIDGEGNAKVGDVKLTAGGDIDVNNSDLQTLATRTNLVDGNLVQYDGTKQTLVDSGKTIGDLALKTDIPTNYVTTDTAQTITGDKTLTGLLRVNELSTYGDTPTTFFRYDNSDNSMNFGSYDTRTYIKGKENEKPLYKYTTGSQIKTKSFVFEDELKDASVKRAETAGKVTYYMRFKSRKNLDTDEGSQRGLWNGSQPFVFSVLESDFFLYTPSDGTGLELAATGVEPGTYNTVTVDTKGRVTAASNESYATKVVQTITGDGSKTSFDITHTLGADVSVQVYLKNQRAGAYTADELVMVDTYTRNNTVTLLFATAPTTTQTFKVVIIG